MRDAKKVRAWDERDVQRLLGVIIRPHALETPERPPAIGPRSPDCLARIPAAGPLRACRALPLVHGLVEKGTKLEGCDGSSDTTPKPTAA